MSDLFGNHIVGFPTRRLKYFSNEKKMVWKRLVLSLNIYLCYETYYHIVTLGILLLPVLQGEIIRPQIVFTAMLLVYQFVEAVVARTVIINVAKLSETFVAVKRLEVISESNQPNFTKTKSLFQAEIEELYGLAPLLFYPELDTFIC